MGFKPLLAIMKFVLCTLMSIDMMNIFYNSKTFLQMSRSAKVMVKSKKNFLGDCKLFKETFAKSQHYTTVYCFIKRKTNVTFNTKTD